MVAIFTTWIILSLVMFQQATRGVDTGATAAVPMAQPRSPADARTAAAPKASLPTTSAPSQAASTTTAPETTAPPTTAPTTAAPATSVPEAARPTTAAPALAPPPTTAPTTAPAAPPTPPTVSVPADPPPAPAPAVLTPSAPTPPPTPGPTLALTASVAKKGTLVANLLGGLTPAATLTAMTVTEGGGELAWTSAAGDYVFNAPNGKDTTVIGFTYVQNAIPVSGNTLTISTS